MSWYKQTAIGTLDPNEYLATVNVSVDVPYSDKYDVEHDKKATIPYRIEIDGRSWGIKAFDVFVNATITINVTLMDLETMRPLEEKPISIDLSQIKQQENLGHGLVTLGDLEIYLDQNFNVDYKQSTLEILK